MAVCYNCGGELPLAVLASCPACGAPLERVVLPLDGARTAAEIAERFFQPAVTYRPSRARYLLTIAVPWLLPAVSARFAGPPWLTGVLAVLALVLSAQTAVSGRPALHALTIDPRGLRHRDRAIPWARVRGALMGGFQRRRDEPEWLEIEVADGPPVRLTRELARTGSIRSLRNLAAIIHAVAAEGDRP